MEVRVQRGTGPSREGLSGAEQRIADLARSFVGGSQLPGLFMVNVNVPDKRTFRQVDAVLWSPHGLVAIEVKGFTEPQSGTVSVPLNGAWTVDGAPAALHTLQESNPLQQAKTAMDAVRDTLSAAGIDPGYVTALVVLVPRARGLWIEQSPHLGTGMEVLRGDRRSLQRFLQRLSHRPKCWSPDDVLAACKALGLSDYAPSYQQLQAEGFPEITTSARPRQYRPPDTRARTTPSTPSKPRTPTPPQEQTPTWRVDPRRYEDPRAASANRTVGQPRSTRPPVAAPVSQGAARARRHALLIVLVATTSVGLAIVLANVLL